MNQQPVTEAELQAHVDDLLPAARRGEIDAWLAERPDEAARLQAYREQNLAIKGLSRSVLEEPVPQRLLDAVATPARTSGGSPFGQRLSPWSLQRIAAGFALACVSGAAGWLAHGQLQAPTLVAQVPAALPAATLSRQAAIAHVVFSPDVRRPVEIGADQEDQLVAWLSKRLGSPIRPPRLGTLGFELIGGRLLPGSTGPVAQFMYHDVTGQRLTLYVSTENTTNRDTAFRFAQEGPVNVFYWIDGKFGYALSAGIDRGQLARVATAVYEQFEQK